MFKNRIDAGHRLAKKLQFYKNQDAVVLAIPRGGIPIGKVVAKALNLPLGITLSKKITHPIRKEYAIGAVSLETEIIDGSIEVPDNYIAAEIEKIRALLREQYRKYHLKKNPESLVDKIVLIVDDGIATGYTMETTINLIRKHHPKQIIVAVPVAASNSIQRLKNTTSADLIICEYIPERFNFVSDFYEDFPQVTDEKVEELLGMKTK